MNMNVKLRKYFVVTYNLGLIMSLFSKLEVLYSLSNYVTNMVRTMVFFTYRHKLIYVWGSSLYSRVFDHNMNL